jgi:EAL domain-containing protein (putative c-di-GMP-specific phosphodiesterase class I)
VAEGIEDAGQLAELQTLGAGLGQGFLFAKPLLPSEISALLFQPAGGFADRGPRRVVA